MKLTHIVCSAMLAVMLQLPQQIIGQITFFENYRPTYRMLRSSLFDMVGRTDNQWAYKWNLKRGVRFYAIPTPHIKQLKWFLPFAESTETISRRSWVLLWSQGAGRSKWRRSDICASVATRRHWCDRCHRRFIDRGQRCNGHQYTAGVNRKQRRIVVNWRSRYMAKIPNIAEHIESIQSAIVRLLHVGWLFNAQIVKVSAV